MGGSSVPFSPPRGGGGATDERSPFRGGRGAGAGRRRAGEREPTVGDVAHAGARGLASPLYGPVSGEGRATGAARDSTGKYEDWGPT